MIIGIISDTHDQVEKVKQSVDVFLTERVELVFHAGDWCSPFVHSLFQDLGKVISVFGNNDADVFKHLTFKPDNVAFKDRFFEDKFDGKNIALVHGDPENVVDGLIAAAKYDVLIRGHNHVAEIKRSGKTLVINPGSLIGPFGKWTHWTAPSVALYDTQSGEARIVMV